MTSPAGAPGTMLKEALVTVNPRPVATSVYPDPMLLMLRFGKVALPETAATLVVPLKVPFARLLPIAIDTCAFDETTFPYWSVIPITTAEVKVLLSSVFEGWVRKTSLLAVEDETVTVRFADCNPEALALRLL